MEKNALHIKKVLLGLVMVFIFLPLLQHYLHLVKERPLNGAFEDAPEAEFSISSWGEGKFQEDYAAWENQHFGFHNGLIRLHNQLGYSMYRVAYANGVTSGKEDYLYDVKYINAYTGKDFLGEANIRDRLHKARMVQDSLAAKGITLLLVFAPGKASFFPEYLPAGTEKIVGPTNYEWYKKLAKEDGLNYIDFRAWFEAQKPVSKYPLFPKCGIHWSSYGALLACDSVAGKLAQLRGRPIPRIRIQKITMRDSLGDADFDIGRGMNLLFGPPAPPMAYPQYTFDAPDGKEMPRLLTVGDSYFWTMPAIEIQDNMFKKVDFLYYNREYYPNCRNEQKQMAVEIDYNQVINDHDVIMILCTDANLAEFGWGFIDQAYNILVIKNKGRVAEASPEVRKIMDDIRHDPNWFPLEVKKAGDRNISIDSMLFIDAREILKLKERKK